MKNRFIIVGSIVFIMLLSLNCCAKEYVIKLNDTIALFSESENPKDRFITVDESELQDYIDAGVVEYYEENMVGYLLPGELSGESTEEETSSSQIWNHNNVNAAFPLSIGAHGNRVKVAVIDTGVNVHSGLEGKVLPGYDYYNGNTDVTDTDGHGTFVSSIIASSNHGFSVESYIVPLKIFYDSGNKDEDGNPIYIMSSSYLKDAIYDAVNKYDCDVINMSLTLNTSTEMLQHIQEAITYAKNNGVILVAAVGNESSEQIYYPAAYEDVIGVGSVDKNNVRSSFSQVNNSVFVTAPGEMVYSTFGKCNENGELLSGYSSGTSFAAPHVSALAAIAKCIKPSITNAQFMDLISTTANNVNNDEGYDAEYGYGVIDCEKAVKKLIEGRSVYISPVVFSESGSGVLLFNNTGSNLPFRLLYTATDSQNVTIVKTANITEFASGQIAKMGLPYTDGNVKYMAWDSLDSLIPLGAASEYIEE